MAANAEVKIAGGDEEVLRQLDEYPWGSDEEFQSGLHAILGPSATPEQAEHLTLRARCFYYSRKHNVPIDFDTYRDWHARQGSNLQPGPTISSALQVVSPQDATGISVLTGNSDGSNTISSEHPAFYPLNFNHIVELITTGQQIPGIKEIPNTILTGQASEATLSKRRKPWEIPRSADRATEESFWKADLGPRLSDANKDMETG